MALDYGTWTYSGDPATSSKDAVRFLIQDTSEDDPQVSDEEIDYLVATHGDPTTAAVVACGVIAASYTQRSVSEKTVGDLKIVYADRASSFRDLATHIGVTGASTFRPRPLLTGRTHSQKDAATDDTDRVDGHIHIGEDDVDGTLSDSSPRTRSW